MNVVPRSTGNTNGETEKLILCFTNYITIYSTKNKEKSSVVERRNRTIKQKMWKQLTIQGIIHSISTYHLKY